MRDGARQIFPSGLRGVIFDCDGVMIDSRDANRIFYNKVLEVFALPPMNPEQERFAFMSTAMEALRRMVPAEHHDEIEAAIASSVDYNRDILHRIRLMPGFMTFIERLHRSGIRMAIDTNRINESMMRVLDFFKLPPYFEPIMTASNVPPKPSSQGVRAILSSWDASPAAVLFVGDSVDDMKAALGADVVFAAFNFSEQDKATASSELPVAARWFAVTDFRSLDAILSGTQGLKPDD